jgi:4-hydroxymandelate oxidase
MDLKEINRQARERFKGACRVCPRCDGRACAGEMPGIGGIGTGSSFMANFDSLSRIKLNLRTIHDASAPDLSYDFFGSRLKMPILVAPVAGMAINMGGGMEEEEYLTGMIEGGREAGSIGFTCDGPVSIFFDLGLKVLKKNQGWGGWSPLSPGKKNFSWSRSGGQKRPRCRSLRRTSTRPESSI